MNPSAGIGVKPKKPRDANKSQLTKNLRLKIALPLVLIGIAWVQEAVDQFFFGGSFNLPITPDGPLWTIFTAPFSHANWGHLIGNTLAFIPLSYLVLLNGLNHYLAVWGCVLFFKLFILLLWPVGGHGMSGVIYGLLGYLFTIGLAERRLISIALTVFAFVMYSGTLPSLLPWVSPPGVGWIGHLMGFLGGVVAALGMFREEQKRA